MDLGLKDKVVMVAASSKGLGFGIAREAAREGAILSMGSRNQKSLTYGGRADSEGNTRGKNRLLLHWMFPIQIPLKSG